MLKLFNENKNVNGFNRFLIFFTRLVDKIFIPLIFPLLVSSLMLIIFQLISFAINEKRVIKYDKLAEKSFLIYSLFCFCKLQLFIIKKLNIKGMISVIKCKRLNVSSRGLICHDISRIFCILSTFIIPAPIKIIPSSI